MSVATATNIRYDANQPTDRANIEQFAFLKVRQKKKGKDLQIQVFTVSFLLPYLGAAQVQHPQNKSTT